MENLVFIGTILGIHLLALVMPGPDFIMAIKNSLQYSRKTGIWTAVGFGLGILVHIFYCLAGLAIIISKSILVFNAIKLLGAGYLIYIGIKSIFAKSAKIEIKEIDKKKDLSRWQAIRIGFLTNALNPKATLFFLGLFTLVITPETPKVIVGITSVAMVLNTMLWFSVVAMFFTQKKIRKAFGKFQGVFNKLFGGLLILIGVKVALSQK